MKAMTLREAHHAIFGHRATPERTGAAAHYHVEKLVDIDTPSERWALMSYGDSDPDAKPGQELGKLIQRAEALEGHVRIRRKKDDVMVWESQPTAADPEEPVEQGAAE